MINFENTYSQLPPEFYTPINAHNDFDSNLIHFNTKLAQELDLDLDTSDPNSLANFFSANEFMPGSKPIAMAYAGHQFGHFVPTLGDGRAMLLGEFLTKENIRYDIHLKGSGPTNYSRRGDGKSAIGPVLREYLVSEAMHALGIPTTRTLCAIRTGELVQREEILPGAVLARVALSHIRIGTFQYFAARGDATNLKILADYTIERLYPHLKNNDQKYFQFWREVCLKQISLIPKWMSVGFIHGVMNTDNMNISGETIDYGPCAFMDNFKLKKVFSSIDANGRYAYDNQPLIAIFNLARFAEALASLLNLPLSTCEELFSKELKNFHELIIKNYHRAMFSKFGLTQFEDLELLNLWFELLETNELDFTLSYIDLERIIDGRPTFTGLEKSPNFSIFLSKLGKEHAGMNKTEILNLMRKNNPLTIPRNHQVEKAIQSSQQGNDADFFSLLAEIKKPFQRSEKLSSYQLAPKKEERVLKTFCGT